MVKMVPEATGTGTEVDSVAAAVVVDDARSSMRTTRAIVC
jgi:hypothetical protein